MSVLLFIVGALAVVVGVGMVAYGIPVNEFSFGNTLIIAGTTAAVGGLIVIAIGIAVGQLQRIAETLASRTPARRPLDTFEPRPTPSRIPFPPRPASSGETQPIAEAAAASPIDEPAAVVPMLKNPDSPVAEPHEVKDYEDIPLSPPQSAPVAQPEPPPPSHAAPVMERPALDEPWRSSPPPPPQQEWPSTSFDAMWPAPRPEKRQVVEELNPAPQPEAEPVAAAPQEPPPAKDPEVAILKSGVVDGMGYTLYVDGSIEAELPHGTLRFASINELREHLAKNT